MTYTFDYAVNQLRELSQKGADTWYGDQLEKRTNVKGHLEAGDVEVIINKIRKEYAPTIEMTKEQYEIFKNALQYTSEHSGDFIYFIDILEGESSFSNDEFKEELVFFINDSKKLMQAWIHPETIKVVDE